MAIATTGPVSFSQLAAEFGGSAPHSFSEFYRQTNNSGAVPHSFGANVQEVYTVALNSNMNSGGTQTIGTTTPSLNGSGRISIVSGNYYNLRVNGPTYSIKSFNGGSSDATAFGWFESPAQNSTGSTNTRSGITIRESHSSWALKNQRSGRNWCDNGQGDCNWSNVWSGQYFSVQGVATANMTLRFKSGSRGSDSGAGSNNRNFTTGGTCSVSNQGGTASVAGTVASYAFNLGGTIGSVSGNFNQNNNADNSAETLRAAINAVSGVTCTRSGRTLTINTGRYANTTPTYSLTQNDGSNVGIASSSSTNADTLEIVNGTVPTSGAININAFRGTRKNR
tara:strand:- start:246 stop:1256 length:1011 start_codon:yes stop_codon:yes gene_type:complete